MTETKKLSFADRFAAAFQKAMRDEHEQAATAAKVGEVGEVGARLIDVVDPDKHLG